MRPLLRTAFAIAAASVALTACSDRPSSAPTAPRQAQPAVATALTLSCDFTALKANARDYAASNQDPLFTIIGALQKSINKSGLNAGATDLAFDGLARLAAMRGTAAQRGTATGAIFDALTTGFIGCMESYITATVPSDFTVAGALTAGWMYEVKGKAGDGSVGAYERGSSPYWSAEAPAGWGASITPASQATRFLIYGFRLTNFLTNDPTVGSAFEIRTVPAIGAPALTLQSPLLIGLCNINPASTVRVQHISTVLTKQTLVCADPPVFALESSGLRLLDPRALAQRAIDFLAPKPAYAFGFGGVGGAVSELSPSVVIDMQSVTLAFVFNIVDGGNSQPLQGTDGGPVKVRVTTQGGTPLSGANVTLAVYGNSSVIAFFSDNGGPNTPSVVRTTDANGIATFTGVSLTKAGGYQLTATGSFDGIAGAPVVSNSFNIQNK